ncbi:hypothetical protein HDV00_009666 [Rhizophlyctis rosea]|nr:hypothetical protein HDV00_009666 [Rhizophlyctis rosea]
MAFVFDSIFRDPFLTRDPMDDLFTRRLDRMFTPAWDWNTNPQTLSISDTDRTETQSGTQPTQQQLTTTTDRPTTTWQALMRAPRLDVSSTEDSYTVKVDLPGLNKENVNIHVEQGNVLAISGEREEAKEEAGERFYRKERSYGKFERRVRMPEDAQLENAEAQMENGVLALKVPKGQKPDERKKITIA